MSNPDPQSGITFIEAYRAERDIVLASDPSFTFAFWVVRHSKRQQPYGCLYRSSGEHLIVLHDDRRIPFRRDAHGMVFSAARAALRVADPD